jgi:ubiquinone/menaquinone biosynthesis C-methylase UbiE
MGVGLFATIAPLYGLFYDSQKRHFDEVLDRVQAVVGLSAYRSIVDVGCGTGALCSVLNRRGFIVTGVDPAQGMLSVGARKQENRGIEFVQASATEKMPFEDKSFDVSIASLVAHGLRAHERRLLYAEMKRISRHLVIIADYNENRSAMTDFIEWLEGGDYFNFIGKVKGELGEMYGEVHTIGVDVRSTWYVCVPHPEVTGHAAQGGGF